jgi:hypothetical protein
MFGWLWGAVALLFHMVAYVLLNSSVNSFCHMIGYRNYDNTATNLRLVAWLTGGEGLHNNHHEHPSAAKFSRKFRRKEFDPAWPLIRLLECCGLARVRPERSPKRHNQRAMTLEKLAHNRLAGRGQTRRVSHSFDAAPGGLCALHWISHGKSCHSRGGTITYL